MPTTLPSSFNKAAPDDPTGISIRCFGASLKNTLPRTSAKLPSMIYLNNTSLKILELVLSREIFTYRERPPPSLTQSAPLSPPALAPPLSWLALTPPLLLFIPPRALIHMIYYGVQRKSMKLLFLVNMIDSGQIVELTNLQKQNRKLSSYGEMLLLNDRSGTMIVMGK